ncbi:hypothetical protein EVAR_31469_1 [Eumeta japonica]|uniref:Uncharacterized protein n=1 Tax=Eumeta variegata TaxID=151549 RepID=A0A4C1WBT6_EUMVA|nr:hypothetical protein EVAR_31469_1 [Eumeta japonica]
MNALRSGMRNDLELERGLCRHECTRTPIQLDDITCELNFTEDRERPASGGGCREEVKEQRLTVCVTRGRQTVCYITLTRAFPTSTGGQISNLACGWIGLRCERADDKGMRDKRDKFESDVLARPDLCRL